MAKPSAALAVLKAALIGVVGALVCLLVMLVLNWLWPTPGYIKVAFPVSLASGAILALFAYSQQKKGK